MPIPTSELRAGRGWVREKLIEDQYMHQLTLANGVPGPGEAGIIGTVFEGTSDPHQIVLNLPEPETLDELGIELADLLGLAERWANELDGLAVVGSHHLFERAGEYGLSPDGQAAYAAFWGEEREPGDPLFARLRERGIDTPHSVVAARSWSDLEAPDAVALKTIQELLR